MSISLKKNHFFCLFLLLFSLSANAQSVEETACVDTVAVDTVVADYPSVMTAEAMKVDYKNTRYWQNNKVKQFAAYTCIGVGATSLALEGLVWILVSAFSGGNADLGWGGATWAGLSVATMSASIPLFISAKSDRKKARSLTWEEYIASEKHQRNYRTTGLRYELSAGMTIPWEDVIGTRSVGWALGFEGRSYLGESNFDLALRFCFDETDYNESGSDHVVSKTAFRMSLISDYNFLKGKMFNPYVGVGVGLSLPWSVNLEPRLGLEISDHHRVSLSSHICISETNPYGDGKQTSNFALSYGYTF